MSDVDLFDDKTVPRTKLFQLKILRIINLRTAKAKKTIKLYQYIQKLESCWINNIFTDHKKDKILNVIV
jgi:hypothetical protein